MLATGNCYVNAPAQPVHQAPGAGRYRQRPGDPNGVIQAIEKRDHRFFIGVQWHPEYMPQSNVQQNLFRGLVASATDNAGLRRP